MARWEPNSTGRLQQAAMELFVERGYDQTTVAEIAGRAGLTERTFFRHFADKREVLFLGGEALQELVVKAIAAAPDDAAPIDAIATALDAVGAMFEGRRDGSRLRQNVIAAHPELQERELIKMAKLTAAMADTLRARGVPDPSASLAAEAGTAVFRIAFERWVGGATDGDLRELMRESLTELKSVTAGTRSRST
ncbi:TetR/AcrR family transcriptional regulator [uncultured Pseudonocardia sp.]|uniref:TetR/AcrR family transcriptional regulator n=1 Tax=uncultured Pseudonocardia sp. TaxID=211455 RepID=UPI0026243E23|nr:TetR/AcrR family transcriptional regulator [uncultured Pseudonocardia sp.]